MTRGTSNTWIVTRIVQCRFLTDMASNYSTPLVIQLPGMANIMARHYLLAYITTSLTRNMEEHYYQEVLLY